MLPWTVAWSKVEPGQTPRVTIEVVGTAAAVVVGTAAAVVVVVMAVGNEAGGCGGELWAQAVIRHAIRSRGVERALPLTRGAVEAVRGEAPEATVSVRAPLP